MTNGIEENVAVLIDAENIGADLFSELLQQASAMGRVIVKRAFADWSMIKNANAQIASLSVEPVHHARNGSNGKNAIDILLTVQALDLLRDSAIDTFVIASGDSDFVPLVRRLRAAGKRVIGAGLVATTSEILIKACDGYIALGSRPEKQSKRKNALTPIEVDKPDGNAEDKLWGSRVDAAWSTRASKPGDSIPGATAASDAAEILGASKLSATAYKTLQRLIKASPSLSKDWKHDKNKVIRK